MTRASLRRLAASALVSLAGVAAAPGCSPLSAGGGGSTSHVSEPQRVALDFHANDVAGIRGMHGAIDPISGTVALLLPNAKATATDIAFYRLADGTRLGRSAVPGCAAPTQPAYRTDWIGTVVAIAAEPEAGAFVVACSREVDGPIETALVSYDATSREIVGKTALSDQGDPTYAPGVLVLFGTSSTDVVMNGPVVLDPRTLARVSTPGEGVFDVAGLYYVDRGDDTFANLGSAPMPAGTLELPFSGDHAFAVMPWLRETIYADKQSLRFSKLGEDGERDVHLDGSPSYVIDVDDAKRETFALGLGKERDDHTLPAEEVAELGDDGSVRSVATLPRGVFVNDRRPNVIDADGTLTVAATDRLLVLDPARTHVARTIPVPDRMSYDSDAKTYGLPGRAAVARVTDTDLAVMPISVPYSHVKTIDVSALP